MRRGYLPADKGDRAKAAGAAAVIHLLLGAAFLTGLALHIDKRRESSLTTFNIEPPPPPPQIAERRETPAKAKAAPAGKKATPSPIVAPPAKIPVERPLNAAPVAGQGGAASAGAATSGTGTGAGGSGNGLGGGGNGGGGGGGGGGRTGAKLISGQISSRDYRAIAGPELPSGSALLVLLVNPAGKVERCRPAASSGSVRIDQTLCAMLSQRLKFRPALEGDGRPIYQDVNYVARWGR